MVGLILHRFIRHRCADQAGMARRKLEAGGCTARAAAASNLTGTAPSMSAATALDDCTRPGSANITSSATTIPNRMPDLFRSQFHPIYRIATTPSDPLITCAVCRWDGQTCIPVDTYLDRVVPTNGA
ncbi:MAG: hypothetical protein OXN84_16275 [Albidovulum sp.]|nr:hypothetical protein [Albidovulum sp.]MDE0531038.1 hypothetical protein [Albidovulum sp.]